MTHPIGATEAKEGTASGNSLAGAVASAMALAFVVPFLLGVLGPFIVDDLSLSPSSIGALVAVAFVVATVASPFAGLVVDAVPGRTTLRCLVLYCAAAPAVLSVSPTYGWLLIVVGASGLAQAAANPVTNRLILDHISASRRGVVMGVKQSGVQAGSFLAGVTLPTLALALGWRGATRVVALLALVVLVLIWRAVPETTPRSRPDDGRRPSMGVPAPPLRWLMAYVFLMGGGVAALSAYLPLFGHDSFGLGETPAGALVAALGATGIVARIAWAARSQRSDAGPSRTLLALAGGATAAAVLLWQAENLGTWALWVGAIALGATAVAQQSVAMLAVLRLGDGRAGQNTAMASMAFFAGFVASPIAFGLLVERSGTYGLAWLVVVAQFALATLVAAHLTTGRHA